jgi:hypothetical protein
MSNLEKRVTALEKAVYELVERLTPAKPGRKAVKSEAIFAFFDKHLPCRFERIKKFAERKDINIATIYRARVAYGATINGSMWFPPKRKKKSGKKPKG